MNTRENILKEVEAFLASSGMAKTNFGREVVGDPKFVDRLREGSDLYTSTGDKVMAFIERHRNHAAA